MSRYTRRYTPRDLRDVLIERVVPLDVRTLNRARATVLANAHDEADAMMLLEALDLPVVAL